MKEREPLLSFDRGQNPIQVPFFQIFLLVLIITVHLLVTEIPTNAQSRFFFPFFLPSHLGRAQKLFSCLNGGLPQMNFHIGII